MLSPRPAVRREHEAEDARNQDGGEDRHGHVAPAERHQKAEPVPGEPVPEIVIEEEKHHFRGEGAPFNEPRPEKEVDQ